VTGAIKRSALYLLAVALAAAGLFYAVRVHRASAASAFPDLLELAPSDSTMIGYADLRTLRESPLVQQLAAMAQPPQVDRDYADFVAATGFDYQRDLDHLLILGRPGAAPGGALVFAEGRFDRQKIEQYALRSGKRAQENGRAVYVVPSTTPGKNIRIAFLAPDRIELSDGGELPVLSTNSSATIDPAMRGRLSRIAGAPVFAEFKATEFASRIGPDSGSPVAAFSSPFRSLQWVSLAFRPDGQEMILSIEGECDTPEAAQRVAGTLELLRGIFRGALSNPKARGQMPAESAVATGKLLDAMKITTEAERARILVSVTPEMLRLSLPSSTPAAH
jgi:hypothetical protein